MNNVAKKKIYTTKTCFEPRSIRKPLKKDLVDIWVLVIKIYNHIYYHFTYYIHNRMYDVDLFGIFLNLLLYFFQFIKPTYKLWKYPWPIYLKPVVLDHLIKFRS